MSATQIYSILFGCLGCVVLVIFLASCSSIPPTHRKIPISEERAFPLSYSMIFIIHGDGDYLYHDTSGNEYRADEEALAGAKRVAQQNPHAEVFIFHQRPRRHFLLFFPLHDGEFYYYRNGRVIANELYWRDQEQSHLDPEVELYRRFRADNQREMVSLFLYFGHEIPEFGGMSYDASYPDRTFTINDLAGGLKEFTRDSTKVDLIVLSTCFNGTPHTISTLAPYARYIIASPDNLHLSYFDLHSLEQLDLSLRDGDVPDCAKKFAHQAFNRLTEDIHTAVTVAAYDVDRVQRYLNSVDSIYDNTLNTINGQAPGYFEHCDCADVPAYALPTMSDGVNVFYRPACFGRLKYKQNHSGWECWRDIGPQGATSQTAEPVLK
jgi:hypothetical protein